MPGTRWYRGRVDDDVPKRNIMSYKDHIEKAYKEGKMTKEEMRKSLGSKNQYKSKYDL